MEKTQFNAPDASTIQDMPPSKAFANPSISPLSLTLLLASRCLAAVEGGRSLTEALGKVPGAHRSAVQAVSLYAMRHWGRARAWRTLALKKPTGQAWFDSLVALSLLLLDVAIDPESKSDDAPRYTAHTLVTQSVDAARQGRAKPVLPGLLNAVLRRFQREHALFIKHIKTDPVAQWGYPLWWQRKLQADYPNDWQAILAVSQTPPRLVLRANTRVIEIDELLSHFSQAGVSATHLGQAAIAIMQTGAVDQLPGYTEGWWSVQDLGAQHAGVLLAPKDGERVLDACAAPGGKTAHLLALAQVTLTGLDQDPDRLARVADNLSRLRLLRPGVDLVAADARDLKAWWDGQPYNAILADLPCTASGVVRRHPDIAWLKRATDLPQTVKQQAEILDALWQTLAPGGRMLMVTCSVFVEEGELQAARFVARHPDARRLPAPGHLLPRASLGDEPGQDGFFYGLFERTVA